MIGGIFNQFMTNVGKYTVGRLRPHFLDVCVPSVQCTNDNLHVYIGPDDYNCTRTSHPDISPDKFARAQVNMRYASAYACIGPPNEHNLDVGENKSSFTHRQNEGYCNRNVCMFVKVGQKGSGSKIKVGLIE